MERGAVKPNFPKLDTTAALLHFFCHMAATGHELALLKLFWRKMWHSGDISILPAPLSIKQVFGTFLSFVPFWVRTFATLENLTFSVAKRVRRHYLQPLLRFQNLSTAPYCHYYTGK